MFLKDFQNVLNEEVCDSFRDAIIAHVANYSEMFRPSNSRNLNKSTDIYNKDDGKIIHRIDQIIIKNVGNALAYLNIDLNKTKMFELPNVEMQRIKKLGNEKDYVLALKYLMHRKDTPALLFIANTEICNEDGCVNSNEVFILAKDRINTDVDNEHISLYHVLKGDDLYFTNTSDSRKSFEKMPRAYSSLSRLKIINVWLLNSLHNKNAIRNNDMDKNKLNKIKNDYAYADSQEKLNKYKKDWNSKESKEYRRRHIITLKNKRVRAERAERRAQRELKKSLNNQYTIDFSNINESCLCMLGYDVCPNALNKVCTKAYLNPDKFICGDGCASLISYPNGEPVNNYDNQEPITDYEYQDDYSDYDYENDYDNQEPIVDDDYEYQDDYRDYENDYDNQEPIVDDDYEYQDDYSDYDYENDYDNQEPIVDDDYEYQDDYSDYDYENDYDNQDLSYQNNLLNESVTSRFLSTILQDKPEYVDLVDEAISLALSTNSGARVNLPQKKTGNLVFYKLNRIQLVNITMLNYIYRTKTFVAYTVINTKSGRISFISYDFKWSKYVINHYKRVLDKHGNPYVVLDEIVTTDEYSRIYALCGMGGNDILAGALLNVYKGASHIKNGLKALFNSITDTPTKKYALPNIINRVLKYSQNRTNFMEAAKEWEVCEWETGYCDCLCGRERIKLGYSIKNTNTGKVLEPIGTQCVSIFKDPRHLVRSEDGTYGYGIRDRNIRDIDYKRSVKPLDDTYDRYKKWVDDTSYGTDEYVGE